MKTTERHQELKHKKNMLVQAASEAEGMMGLVWANKARAIQADIDALLVADAIVHGTSINQWHTIRV